MGELKGIRDAFSKMQVDAMPPAKRARTVREEKLAGDSPRRQKKDRKIEEMVLRQRGRRNKDDQSKSMPVPDDVHMNMLKV